MRRWKSYQEMGRCLKMLSDPKATCGVIMFPGQPLDVRYFQTNPTHYLYIYTHIYI